MPPSQLHVDEVRSPKELRRYIRLPERLPGQRPNYVPPIHADERAFHDPGKNPALGNCSVVRFLAWKGVSCVGRIMGIVHHAHNQAHGERTARFYQLDMIDDPHVGHALLGAVENWARGLGMQQIIGPFGLSDKDPQGVQVEGFEHLPVLATPANPAFLPKHITANGYVKLSDALAYRTAVPAELPAGYRQIADRLVRQGHLRVLNINSRKALRPWVVPVLRLVNEGYKDLLGFVPMDEKEMQRLAAQYLPVLDPGLVKIVVDGEGRAVAFVVAMPDMSKGLQRARGRLFPFGFLHLLRAMRQTRQLNLLLGAVQPRLQGRGLTCLLAVELLGEARRRGFACFDSHLVLETNQLMRAELERLGGSVWKRYRVYAKAL